MRQPTLAQVLNSERSDSGRCLEVYDLFCGAGGFSAGAAAAGCRVAFACDMDAEALKTHEVNHPDCQHLLQELPADDLPLPADGRAWHLHASPPCQKLSSASTRARSQGDKDHALELVRWFLTLALRSHASSWTLEQVASPQVLDLVESVRRSAPTRMAYDVFYFETLGVPQTRRRLIAGSPRLIGKLLRARESQPRRSVRDVLPVPRGTHVRNDRWWSKKRLKNIPGGRARYVYTKCSWTDGCWTVRGPAPTVLQSRLFWIRRNTDGTLFRDHLRVDEYASLQTFPPDYVFPERAVLAQKLIANAVPPLVAQLLLA